MTKEKKLKQAVRARAAKTGERYAEARRQVLAARKKGGDDGPSSKLDADAIAASAKGMISEAKCVEKTGHGLRHWFEVLDRFDLKAKGHTAAAKHLGDDHEVGAWYAQTICVAYERAHGLRKVGETSRGYQVSVSRILPCDAKAAASALSRRAARDAWLDGADEDIAARLTDVLGSKRLARRDDGAYRLRFDHDGALTELFLDPLEDGRSRLVVTTSKLASEQARERRRARWKTSLDALRAYLKRG